MSVLERFFQISMVMMVATLGITMMLNVFGEPMTGQSTKFVSDVNYTTAYSIQSQISQTSTAPTSLPPIITDLLLSAINNQFIQIIFKLQIVIYLLLVPFGLGAFALILDGIISTIQIIGTSYLVVSGIAILRGSGGTP